MSSFARQALGPIRTLTDEAGTRWHVCEVAYALDRRAGRSLVFESENAVRRVRGYPTTWLELSDRELAELLEMT